MMRIGHGYDVHRLVPGRRLVLGGTEIPYEKGLLGHSDADAALHALCDAILGALGEGDIGKHFPDSDPAYKDIDSLILLSRTAELMGEKGYSLGNADLTIIAQAPKLAPYIPEMKERIAAALGCDPGRINVKATTEEKLGFTGSGEGIACHAVALIEK
ncbi:MAG: 2-C-methyl-D-erythritol 2,4-cyclodiphosphate synthase [Clostridia bacterium]|nr:2-C-methyl-D-erythritol 2,4-cyclodiphosphate synthase [Clostridia bacterium]